MISWIKGEVISSWLHNKKQYILLNCQGLGYEVQILNYLKSELNKKTLCLWIKHIKKEDSDLFFGFIEKEERDFFRDLLNIKGIGPQIGMSLLNKFSLDEITNSVKNKDENFITSVPGIGKKMSERLLFELKNKLIINNPLKIEDSKDLKDSFLLDDEFKLIFDDIEITLKSLNYSQKEIKETLLFLTKNIKNAKLTKVDLVKKFDFECLLKIALNNKKEML